MSAHSSRRRAWCRKMIMVLLPLAGSAGAANAMTVGSTANPPVGTIVDVNVIDVCGATGTGCAPTGSLSQYESFTKDIFAQSGTSFVFSPVMKLNLAAPACGGVSAASRFCSETNFATDADFDTVHQLIDGSGHKQSSVATTLNVYLVNSLVQTTNGAQTFAPIYGWGLIGGNGVAVETGRNQLSGLLTAPDVLAHELGHNLGLEHVDQSPLSTQFIDPGAAPGSTASIPTANPPTTYPDGNTPVPVNSPLNLMNTGSRAISTQPCAIMPYTCGGTGTGVDKLQAFQTSTAHGSPVINELPNVHATVSGGTITETYVSNDPGQTPLIGGALRYLASAPPPGVPFVDWCVGAGGCAPIPVTTTTDSAGDVIYGFSGPPIAPTATDVPSVLLEWDTDSVPTPLSIEFDFADGVTSRAGFDLTGFDSQVDAEFGFNPNAPGVVYGPSVLPEDGVPEDTDSYGVPALAAPEPGGLGLLLFALVGLGAIRGRRWARTARVPFRQSSLPASSGCETAAG